MAKGFKLHVSEPYYYSIAGSIYQHGHFTCSWGVCVLPIINGEAQEDLVEYHIYPVKPTKKQLRKLTKRVYQVLAEDLLK